MWMVRVLVARTRVRSGSAVAEGEERMQISSWEMVIGNVVGVEEDGEDNRGCWRKYDSESESQRSEADSVECARTSASA